MSSMVFKGIMSTLFDVDSSEPLSVLNSNNPYFNYYFNNEYIPYITQLQNERYEQEQLQQQKAQKEAQISNNAVPAPAPKVEPLKEVSSSITFEGDVDSEDIKRNPMVSSGEIQIINESSYAINIDKLLMEPLKLKLSKTGPQVLIYHTHTTESYLKSLKDKSVDSRTTNSNFNVVRVGEELTKNLQKYKIGVLHNSTIHDIDYNQSYGKSLKTLTSYVDKYKSLNMTIDLHRDAIGGEKLRVVKNINGKNAARVMFVIGTDQKLSNPNWKENLKLALKVQKRLNEICPGLAKPIYISKSRYNQHLTNGSVIIEVGGDGNVLDECLLSTKYLAQAINDVVYKKK
jgi:stage II sporulation protein P